MATKGKYLELKTLGMDELTGVVNLYPWYGGARKELFSRLLALGGGEASRAAYEDAAMYVPSRRVLAKLLRDSRRRNCADKDAEKLLKTYISSKGVADANSDIPARKVFVVGGDYFSQDQYDKVKAEDGGILAGFKFGRGSDSAPAVGDEPVEIYTETLAQIYAEQGYYDQAKQIYSKLLLAEPKKNAYFAALIEKLEQIQSTI